MKKSKAKRTPPRRKLTHKEAAARKAAFLARDSQPLPFDEPGFGMAAEDDEIQARNRAMQEMMPPDVRQEWLSPDQLSDDRYSAILDEYDGQVTPEAMARHLADVRREREEKAMAAGAEPEADGSG